MRFFISAVMACSGSIAIAEVPRVATDIAPVHGLVSRVMEGVGAPELIVLPGTSPHGHAMRPSQARALAQADVVFWVGPALSPWLEEPIETLATNAEHVTFTDVEAITLLAFRDDARFEPHDHGHGDAHGDHAHESLGDEEDHDRAEAGHEHGSDHGRGVGAVDGHLWLDPDNAKVMLDVIAQRLAEHDPEHARIYRNNAQEAQQRITSLSDKFRQELEPVSERAFIVAHDSYHYFEAHFGVWAAASISLADEGTASAAQLAKVREAVNESGATCALAEQRANEGLIEAVGGDMKVTTLDAVGIDIALGADYYPSLLTQIAEGLLECLSDR